MRSRLWPWLVVLAACLLIPLAAIAGEAAGPAQDFKWGDADCNGDILTRDGQAILRDVLQQDPLSQMPPCFPVGSDVQVQGMGTKRWADADCDGNILARDSQAVLRRVLQQDALSQTPPCPAVGTTAQVGVTGTATPTGSAIPTGTTTPTATATPTGTGTATATPPPSPSTAPLIEFCWMAPGANGIVTGFQTESCRQSAGPSYSCTWNDPSGVDTCVGQAPYANYTCTSPTPPQTTADCQAGTSSDASYSCAASGTTVSCATTKPGSPNYDCNVVTSEHVRCLTPAAGHADFDCLWSSFVYSCGYLVATGAATPTPSPAAAPLIKFCWMAAVANGIVTGFQTESCQQAAGPSYSCTWNDPVDTCVGQAPSANYTCTSPTPPGTMADCHASTPSAANYSCAASGSTVSCTTTMSGWPNYDCNVVTPEHVRCLTPAAAYADFDCLWSSFVYSCGYLP